MCHLCVCDLRKLRTACWGARSKWKHIGIELNFIPGDLEAISESKGGDVDDCFTELLTNWLRWINPSPTLAALALALEHPSVGHQQLVESLKDLGTFQNESHEVDVTNVVASISFPLLADHVHDERSREELEQQLKVETKALMYKFFVMLNKFFDSLDDQSIPIPTLLRYLSSPLETSSFSLEPTVLNHIFKIIRTNSSFFNYDLVEYMIDLTGTQDDKKRLGEYKAEFIAYAQRRIYECPSTFGATLTPNDTELHVKLDSHYDSCKASELKEFQYRLRLTFKLKRLYARLLSIEQGCLKLVYAIPKHVVETTFPLSAEQKEALKECGVVELTCSHYQFLQKVLYTNTMAI